MTLELCVSEMLHKSCSLEVKTMTIYEDHLKNFNNPNQYHFIQQVLIQTLSGSHEYASVLKNKKGKQPLEIIQWDNTDGLRSMGYGLEMVCHLQLRFLHSSFEFASGFLI